MEKKYRDAFVQQDKASVGIYQAQREQAEVQLALVEEQLARTQAEAPFDGVIVSGDLTQRLGAPVKQGETLLQIAPLDNYRIMLDVDERRIADIRIGQQGQLVLSALPNEQFVFKVEKITPVATAGEGINTFRVEARLEQPSDKLRPGMQGTGKINIDRRNLLQIWTRGLVLWWRAWLWKWWP